MPPNGNITNIIDFVNVFENQEKFLALPHLDPHAYPPREK